MPTLSVQDTLHLHAEYAKAGLHDALRWKPALESIRTSKIIQTNLLKSTLIQVIIVVSLLIFEPILLWLHDNVEDDWEIDLAIHILWLYPVSVVSIVFSCLYSGTVCDPTYSAQAASAAAAAKRSRGLAPWVLEQSFLIFAALNWFLIAYLFTRIPYIGWVLAIPYMSVVNAYYCFEPQWIMSQKSFRDRVDYLEHRCAYFFGFGLPVTLVSYWWSDPTLRLALFSLAFPFFVLTASSSYPQPSDPNVLSAPKSTVLPDTRSPISLNALDGGIGGPSASKAHSSVLATLPILRPAVSMYEFVLANFLPPSYKKRSALDEPLAYGRGKGAGYSAYKAPAATGFAPPAATGFAPPAATGFAPPAATGFAPPAATGFAPPAATGFAPPAATGFAPPAATGFAPPGAPGFAPPAPKDKAEAVTASTNLNRSTGNNDVDSLVAKTSRRRRIVVNP